MDHAEPTGGNAPLYAPVVRAERLADRVANTLTEMILSGQLAVGSRLPAERDLCERLGVSRPVLREAVRSLTAKGLLEDNPGRGHIVRTYGRESLAESLTLYLRGQRLDYGGLMEVRSVIEVEAAGFAAERAKAADLDDLREALGQLRPGLTAEAGAVADLAFHRSVATATGNAFFVVLIDSIRDVLLAVQLPTLAEPTIVQEAMSAHQRIADEITGGSPERARAAMRDHLRAAEIGLRSVLQANPTSARID